MQLKVVFSESFLFGLISYFFSNNLRNPIKTFWIQLLWYSSCSFSIPLLTLSFLLEGPFSSQLPFWCLSQNSPCFCPFYFKVLWYLYFHPFTFTYIHCWIWSVSYKKHIVVCLFIHSANPCLWIIVFIFNITWFFST